MKRQKDVTLKGELPRSVGTQYATGEEQRNSSRRNEQEEPSGKNTQLWMYMVVRVKPDALRTILHRNLEC